MKKELNIKKVIVGLIRKQKFGKFFIGFLLLFVLVELLSQFFHLPNLSQILAALIKLWHEGTLVHDISVSSLRWIIGWSIGSFFGIITGLITGRNKYVSYFSEGLIVILRSIPYIAILPIIAYIYGLSENGKFFLVGWACFGVTWAILHESALKVPDILIWKTKSLGINKVFYFIKILLPNLNTQIYSSLRASLSLGLIVVAVSELSGVYEYGSGVWWSEGIGYRIFRASDQARDDIMMAAILIFALMGVLYDSIFKAIWILISYLKNIISKQKILRETANYKRIKKVEEYNFLNTAQIKINNLNAGYSDNLIFDDFNLEINPGEVLSLVGYSGCGKSTLLKAIGRLSSKGFKVNGEVFINKKPIVKVGPEIGIVFQDASVFDNLSVWENAIIGNNIKSNNDKFEVFQLICVFGLQNQLTSKAKNLSGGQKQRLALLSAISNKPQLLLLDEPFGALDAINRDKLQAFFNHNIKGKIASIFVTHDINEAINIGNRLRVGLQKGPIEFKIDKEKVFDAPDYMIKLKKEVFKALEKTI